ncbi:MAG: hypothetical protein GY719_25485 [bacterium]|nr:hypothetical protein [bacterium]
MRLLRPTFVLLLALALTLPALADPVVRVLHRGSPIQGTNGIAVGPDGKLYVTSVSGREIVVMNRNSGRILERFGVGDRVVVVRGDASNSGLRCSPTSASPRPTCTDGTSCSNAATRRATRASSSGCGCRSTGSRTSAASRRKRRRLGGLE